jgi:MFS family permease
MIFGMCAILMAYAKSYPVIMVLRLFIGLGEATVQTSFLYTSLWYRREEMSVRAGQCIDSSLNALYSNL